MAVTIMQDEVAPASWPDPPTGLSDKTAPLDPAAIWSRIESWTTTRWSPRTVMWIVEGEGAWTPPLTPATVTSAEVWENGGWIVLALKAGPYCYDFAGDGPYRITATVGAGPAPAAVLEAFRRLAEYSAEIDHDAALTSHETSLGPIDTRFERPSTWAARAIINSGAADLLRPYRRAA